MTHLSLSGGCQCGAVRFRLVGEPGRASICHCRMCQKAFGAYYAPLVAVGAADLTWTRGARKLFQSSNIVQRGFCADCGTPLTYEAPDGVALAAGAFDDPSLLPPGIQFGTEARIDFVNHLHGLPARETEQDTQDAPFILDIVSYQHPDHETAVWPEEAKHD